MEDQFVPASPSAFDRAKFDEALASHDPILEQPDFEMDEEGENNAVGGNARAVPPDTPELRVPLKRASKKTLRKPSKFAAMASRRFSMTSVPNSQAKNLGVRKKSKAGAKKQSRHRSSKSSSGSGTSTTQPASDAKPKNSLSSLFRRAKKSFKSHFSGKKKHKPQTPADAQAEAEDDFTPCEESLSQIKSGVPSRIQVRRATISTRVSSSRESRSRGIPRPVPEAAESQHDQPKEGSARAQIHKNPTAHKVRRRRFTLAPASRVPKKNGTLRPPRRAKKKTDSRAHKTLRPSSSMATPKAATKTRTVPASPSWPDSPSWDPEQNKRSVAAPVAIKEEEEADNGFTKCEASLQEITAEKKKPARGRFGRRATMATTQTARASQLRKAASDHYSRQRLSLAAKKRASRTLRPKRKPKQEVPSTSEANTDKELVARSSPKNALSSIFAVAAKRATAMQEASKRELSKELEEVAEEQQEEEEEQPKPVEVEEVEVNVEPLPVTPEEVVAAIVAPSPVKVVAVEEKVQEEEVQEEKVEEEKVEAKPEAEPQAEPQAEAQAEAQAEPHQAAPAPATTSSPTKAERTAALQQIIGDLQKELSQARHSVLMYESIILEKDNKIRALSTKLEEEAAASKESTARIRELEEQVIELSSKRSRVEPVAKEEPSSDFAVDAQATQSLQAGNAAFAPPQPSVPSRRASTIGTRASVPNLFQQQQQQQQRSNPFAAARSSRRATMTFGSGKRSQGKGNVRLGPLPSEFTDRQVKSMCRPFAQLGLISSVSVTDAMGIKHAVVQFSHPADAASCVQNFVRGGKINAALV